MPAYNFKPEYAGLVQVGAKRQTIRRARRRRPTMAGDVLYLYKGMRTKACENIGDHWCYAVNPLELRADGLHLDGMLQPPEQAHAIARADGFPSLEDLITFMVGLYGPLPLEDLRLIKWEHLVVATMPVGPIQPGHMGRIIDYYTVYPTWGDITIDIEFHGHPARSVRPGYIRSVFAPDHIWPGRPFERVTVCH